MAGCHDLGTSGRGRATEINTYVEKMLFSELSGNLADVCPVGALNNGPFAYTSRPYELLTKNTIDLMDSLGSNVAIDYKDNTIMRVNPRVHEAINEEWLSDKSRQAYDGLKRQRLRVPLLRKGADFAEQSWEDIFTAIAARIDKVEGKDIACGIGEFESIENVQALKDFLNALNCFNYEFRSSSSLRLPNNFRADYIFNSQIEMIEDADAILLVGVNPRTEAPILNARILKAINKKKAKVYSIGTPADLTYAYAHLGNSATTLTDIASGKHPVAEELKAAKLPLMIIGYDTLTRVDTQAILETTKSIANTYKFINAENGWNGYNVLHRNQGQINALELGVDFTPIRTPPKVIFLLGCDNNITPEDIPKNAFVVYIVTLPSLRGPTETRERSTPTSSSPPPPTPNAPAPTVTPWLRSEHRGKSADGTQGGRASRTVQGAVGDLQGPFRGVRSDSALQQRGGTALTHLQSGAPPAEVRLHRAHRLRQGGRQEVRRDGADPTHAPVGPDRQLLHD